jgi:hypothetical protein
MANEITQTARLSFRKGSVSSSFESTTRIDMAGEDFLNATQLIGTTAETLNLGEIGGVPAQILIKNIDATNFVEIGGNTDLETFKIKISPGRATIIEPTSATLYAKANTAAVRIQLLAIEA